MLPPSQASQQMLQGVSGFSASRMTLSMYGTVLVGATFSLRPGPSLLHLILMSLAARGYTNMTSGDFVSEGSSERTSLSGKIERTRSMTSEQSSVIVAHYRCFSRPLRGFELTRASLSGRFCLRNILEAALKGHKEAPTGPLYQLR